MVIIEGFCVDFYCDCDGCQLGKIYLQGQVDFIGWNMIDIFQQVCKVGWCISKDCQCCYVLGYKILWGVN